MVVTKARTPSRGKPINGCYLSKRPRNPLPTKTGITIIYISAEVFFTSDRPFHFTDTLHIELGRERSP